MKKISFFFVMLFCYEALSSGEFSTKLASERSPKAQYLYLNIIKEGENIYFEDVFYWNYKSKPKQVFEKKPTYKIVVLDTNEKIMNTVKCDFFEHVGVDVSLSKNKQDNKSSYFSISLAFKYNSKMKKVKILKDNKEIAASDIYTYEQHIERMKKKD